MSGINIKFGATDAGFTSTVSKVNNSVKGMDSNVKKMSGSVKSSFSSMVKAGAALAVGFGAIRGAISAVRGTFDEFKEALDLGGELSDLSARTGETAGNLLVLQRAFQNSGAGAEKVGPSINKLQRAIVEAGQGITTYKRAFESLGVSLDELQGKSPTEQFALIAQKLTEMRDPTERAAAAMQILGRSGGELLPFLTDFGGEIETAKAQLGSLPGVMDRSANSFDKISDQLNVLKGKTVEMAAGFLESAIPALNQFINAGSELDAAGFGANIANRLRDAFQMITNGEMWKIFALQAEKAITTIETSPAWNGFAAAVNAIWDGITDNDADWDTSFEKYKNAGVDANLEIIEQIDEQISALWEKQGDRAAKTAAKFAADIAKAKAERAADDIFGGLFDDQKKGGTVEEFNMVEKYMGMKPTWSYDMMANLKTGADAMEKAAKKAEESLTISQRIVEKIKETRDSERRDPGGALESRAEAQIERGRFGAAARTAERIRQRELDQQIKDAFGPETEGGKQRKFGKSIQDIAKEQGVDTFRKTSKQLREELAEKAKQRQVEMDAKKRGQRDDEGGKGKQAEDPMKLIQNAVEEIKKLVQKIEPKLPTHALTA